MTAPTRTPNAVLPEGRSPEHRAWWLYLLECQDGSYYVGITANLQQRLRLHLAGRGSTYTRRHPVARLVASLPAQSRSHASQQERRVKRLPLIDKLRYFGVAPF